MQYLIIRLSQCSEEEHSAIVSDDRELMIGTAPTSDLRLHVSFGLPDDCLRVRVEQGVCVSENLTGDPGLVFVNGQQVFGIMQLDDGDALQIGSDQFAVVFDKSEPESEPEVTEGALSVEGRMADNEVAFQDPVPSEFTQGVKEQSSLKISAYHETVTFRQTATGECFENGVLADLFETPDAFLLANFKASHNEVPSIRVAGEDLLQDLPESIRSQESLHAHIHLDRQRRKQLWDQVKGHDASVWCFPSEDIQSCLLDIKLYAAWFVRPSALETVLKNNPGDFKQRILRSFRMLVIQDAQAVNRWHLYTKANVNLDHSSHHSLFADG